MKELVLGRYVNRVFERYQALTLRERVLIALSMLSLTWMVWQATLGGFLADSQARISRQVHSVNARIDHGTAENSRLKAARVSDPNARLARERERLDAELRELNESLGTVLDRFVDPEMMPALLEDVIRRHAGLTLKRIQSLPVEPIELTGQRGPDRESSPMHIYRHPLRLEFEGSYFEVLAYLAELERGPWEFGWRQMNYAVGEYPLARVTIEIETLSRDKNWIGV